ncbi:hypothetical protein LTR85_000416 [Meristemomyces frigidus]|nr:hypothetical protein LTR85_000416 [Meristemomyces frigidus]
MNATGVKWMLVTLITPEGITWIAICDYYYAKETVVRINIEIDRFNKAIGSPNAEDVQSRQSWTLTHGYFVNMGGFTLKLSSGDRRRLNGEQFCHLIEKHTNLFPSITKEDIQDKSKADCKRAEWQDKQDASY